MRWSGSSRFIIFNAVPEDKIRRSLDMLIRHHRTILAEQKTLVADYQANQAGRLWQDVSDPEEQFKYLPVQDRAFWQHLMYQQLLVERNQQWLVRLVEILAAAAHVGGGGRGAFIWRTRPDFAAAASGLSGGAGAA